MHHYTGRLGAPSIQWGPRMADIHIQVSVRGAMEVSEALSYQLWRLSSLSRGGSRESSPEHRRVFEAVVAGVAATHRTRSLFLDCLFP